jgi:DNA-binding MltR family transcriptional regulator
LDKIKNIYNERENFHSALGKETDRGKCLTSASYFEYQLGHIIDKKLVGDNKIKVKLFDFNGPLGTFSARIDMAYYLGLIGKEAKRDLHTLRKMRNVFAHDYSAITFDDKPICNLCNEFYYNYLDRQKNKNLENFLSAINGLFTIIKLQEEEVEKIQEADDMSFSVEMKQYVERLRKEQEK